MSKKIKYKYASHIFNKKLRNKNKGDNNMSNLNKQINKLKDELKLLHPGTVSYDKYKQIIEKLSSK